MYFSVSNDAAAKSRQGQVVTNSGAKKSKTNNILCMEIQVGEMKLFYTRKAYHTDKG